jgi:hypothetical protein
VAGYYFSNVTVADQRCLQCEAGFYCGGVLQPSTPCPSGTYSDIATRSSAECYESDFILMTVWLPLSVGQFNTKSMDLYRVALATAAGCDVTRVKINGVIEISDRRTERTTRIQGTIQSRGAGSSIEIQTGIATKNEKEAQSFLSRISDETISAELLKVGLPQGVVVFVVVVASSSSTIFVHDQLSIGPVVPSLTFSDKLKPDFVFEQVRCDHSRV